MNEFWLIDDSYLRTYLEQIYSATAEEVKAATEKMGDSFQDLMKEPEIYSVEGDRAIIKISGPLSKNKPSFFARLFGFGGTQYQQIIDSVEKAEADPMVKSIDLLMDTPGGTVAGADPTNRAIANAKKPVRTINAGMVASAGYYLAVASNKIVSSDVNAQTGSIGVMVAGVSFKDADKRYGIKEITIRSSNAKNKNPDIDTKAGQDEIQKRIDAMENVFIQRVSEGRGVSTDKVKSDFGQGSMFIAQNPDGMDAIKAGMIDGMLSDEAEMIEGNDDFTAQETESTAKAEEIKNNSLQMGKEILTVNDFEKFLSENPNAKAIYDRDIANAKAEGKKDAETAQAAVVAKVGPILASDSYDKTMKDQAVKALAGDMTVDTFMAVVSMEDMRLERVKEEEAKAETDETEETAGDSTAKEANVNTLETVQDVKAAADLMQEVL